MIIHKQYAARYMFTFHSFIYTYLIQNIILYLTLDMQDTEYTEG